MSRRRSGRLDPSGHPATSESVWRLGLSALVLIALALRGWKGELTLVIARDGVAYLDQARALAEGRWSAGLGGYYPPLFPALVAPMTAFAAPETAGRLISALAGALALIPLARIGRRRFGATAGLFAAGALAVLPRAIILGGEVLSDSLFLLGMLVAVELAEQAMTASHARSAGLAAAGAGLAAGAAALTRPEGLMLPGLLALFALIGPVEDAEWRGRRWVTALLILGVGALVFSLRPVALRAETGEWRLTRKAGVALGGYARLAAREARHVPVLHQQLSAERRARQDRRPPRDSLSAVPRLLLEAPGLVLAKVARDSGALLLRLPLVVHPLLLIIALAGHGDRARRSLLLQHPLALVALGQCLAVVLAASSVEKRYLLPVAAWSSMAVGAALAAWLGERGAMGKAAGLPSSGPAAWSSRLSARFAVCLILGLLIAAPALRSERESRLGVKALAALLATESNPTEGVVGLSPRVAFYADRRSLALPFCESAEDLATFQRVAAAPWLVLRDGRQAARLPWLASSAGAPKAGALERSWRRVARVGDLELWHLREPRGGG